MLRNSPLFFQDELVCTFSFTFVVTFWLDVCTHDWKRPVDGGEVVAVLSLSIYFTSGILSEMGLTVEVLTIYAQKNMKF